MIHHYCWIKRKCTSECECELWCFLFFLSLLECDPSWGLSCLCGETWRILGQKSDPFLLLEGEGQAWLWGKYTRGVLFWWTDKEPHFDLSVFDIRDGYKYTWKCNSLTFNFVTGCSGMLSGILWSDWLEVGSANVYRHCCNSFICTLISQYILSKTAVQEVVPLNNL